MKVPIAMALDVWKQATVCRIEQATENTRRYFLRVPAVEEIPFKPGQFITFDLPIHEKKTKRVRSYSIASAPGGGNELELVIVYVPGGAATGYLWNEVKEGDVLTFKGPMGVFTLPETLDKELCFISTGTGIAPFRSMLLDLKNHPRPHGDIHLIFGTRYVKDILYRQEMEALQQEIPNFRFITTLSRETSPAYTGRKGYVHGVYEELFADGRDAAFYLCGWRNMIDEAQQRLLDMGYHQRNIRMELYG